MAVLLECLRDALTSAQPLHLLASLILALFVSRAVATLRQYNRLRHIKGPSSAGFSKWWLIKHVTGGNTHLDLYDVALKYGDIARVGPNDLITCDPGLIKHMTAARSQYKRSYWYFAMRFNPARDNALSTIDEADHTKLRAKMTHGYSGKEVENLEQTIDENVLALVDLIQKYASQGKTLDFGLKAQFFTMDTITQIAFGNAFGFLPADDDLFDYCKTFQEQVPKIILTTIYPWLVNVLQWPIIKKALPSANDPLGFGKAMAIAQDTAAKRYAPGAKQQRDMLGSFKAHGTTQDEAESETLLQIIAGSDTTATAIRATMLHVMTSPRILAKLLAGVAEKLGESPPDRSVISDATARTLPYLQAVIKEGLRIHPPVVGLQSKEVPPGGDTWKGVHLPGGTDIGYCYWGLMRREDVWGEDAAEFRPERWLEASPEKLAQMESTLELAFGSGRWQCLGRNVALMELNKVFVELLRRFDFALVDPTKPWTSINAGVFIQYDYWVRVYQRE